MTVGEVNAVIWAKTRGDNNPGDGLNDDDLADLYEDLKAAKNGK